MSKHLSKAAFLARMAAGRAAAAKTGKRSQAKKRTRAGSAAERNAAHVIIEMGDILAVEYRQVGTGKLYRHDFKGNKSKLGYFRDRRSLAITPVRIVTVKGRQYIGD